MPKKPLDMPLITLGPNVEILLLNVFFNQETQTNNLFYVKFGLLWSVLDHWIAKSVPFLNV